MRKPVLVVLCLLLPAAVFAQLDGPVVPESISFNGRLADGSGLVVPDGSYNLLFKLYDGGVKVWEENHIGVPVSSGVFGVILGGAGSSLASVPFREPLELGITVNGGTEIAPRTTLTSAAFALGVRGLVVVGAQTATGKGPNVLAGDSTNHIAAGVIGATISGGGGDLFGSSNSHPDSVLGDWGTIGGGLANVAGKYSTIAGGFDNSAKAEAGAVGGGHLNDVRGDYGSIAGGLANDANGEFSTVAGGFDNDVDGGRGTIGGGSGNYVSGFKATVPGGSSNLASGNYSFAAGDQARAVHNGTFVWGDAQSAPATFESTGDNQFLIQAGGGVGVNTASPNRELTVFDRDDSGDSFINVTATNSSDRELLLGVNQSTGGVISMQTNNALDFRTNSSSRMKIEADGQIAIARSSASHPVHVGTNSSTGNGAHVTAGGSWTNGSSRNFKSSFEDVDPVVILHKLADLPVTTWTYGNPDEGRHMGPVAEDFAEAFGLGADERYISTTDADGVAMAAIQGLYRLVMQQRKTIERLERRVAGLE